MNGKIFILLFSVILFSGGIREAAAQKTAAKTKSFQLTVKMKNYPDSLNHVLLLGRYYGGSQYIVDTIKYNPKTKDYTVYSDTPKEGGLYLLITADRNYAELIIDKNQQYTVEATYPDILSSIKFIGSPENQLYQDFAADGTNDVKKLQKFNEEYKRLTDTAVSKEYDSVRIEKIKAQVTEVYKEMDEKKDKFVKDHPEHLMSILFKAQKEVVVPAAPEEVPDSLKQEWQYEYYKNHYFDNFDLCDDRVVRTPLFHQRLADFCDKVLRMQLPDTVKVVL